MSAKLYKILLILGIVITLSAVPVFVLSYDPPKELEVDFFDVGQGDAILIKSPMGQNILIDGGPDNKVIEELGKNLPFWDKQIDLMVLTHPHDDHATGLIEVIKRYSVKKILYTGVVHGAPNYLAWLEEVRERKIPLIIIDRPQKIVLGDSCYLDIIYPTKSLLGQEVENLNNSSIVAKLVYGQTKFLLTGDAEAEVEKELLDVRVDLSAQVLKTGHHGSDTSSSEDFLEAVNPKLAVIQVGKDNDFGHPSLRILKRLERIGAEILRTDINGAVKIISNGKEIDRK
ncbi:MAG: ComEC/Rec2 family competence protein [Patescibacteria group bacterium]|nr:ComEC/Rec2 family competence protein [Patescibacteria group bacterium]MDD5294696.1 ComEC/Rec2 family competence protein [Patescibacteria group bacterium]MDD5554681.1 ComEC/Rec2 family competence protein [Patescibacteria group bacterium]